MIKFGVETFWDYNERDISDEEVQSNNDEDYEFFRVTHEEI